MENYTRNKYKGQILLQFYSCKNFGDDMFVRIFAEHFSDYRIMLICNPLQIPQDFPENIDVLTVASWLISINKKIGKHIPVMNDFLKWINNKIITFKRRKMDASVIITGSIYMDNCCAAGRERCFAIDPTVERDFAVSSDYQSCDGDFVIGANIGPIYRDNFVAEVEKEISKLKHICLRDYASYMVLQNKKNVHYAPDVLFLTKTSEVITNKKYHGKMLISVMNIDTRPISEENKTAYYRLIQDVIRNYGEENCCLISFCKKEGDSQGVERVLMGFEDVQRQKILCLEYDDNSQEILEAFKSCEYVVSTRFHSMILAAAFGKKFFPISYNCKIENYLSDLKFSGNYTNLNGLVDISPETVMKNKEIESLYDNTDHLRYAENQFLVLKKYIKDKSEKICT